MAVTVEKPTRPAQSPGPGTPFAGIIDAVIVDGPAQFQFDGSLTRPHIDAMWLWVARDLAPDLCPDLGRGLGPQKMAAIAPDLIRRITAATSTVQINADARKRLRAQVGGDEVMNRLPVLVGALKAHQLIDRAIAFGRAANGLTDDQALSSALKAMPLADQQTLAFLMHAVVGQVAAPHRLMLAMTLAVPDLSEVGIARAGFAPLVEAILAQAQAQLTADIWRTGAFSDIDLACRAIERFHRLIRAVNQYVELHRGSPWLTIMGELVSQLSGRIEPRLRYVAPDILVALRKQRSGVDRVDSDQILAALNGMYLLATVRACRESLALNVACDEAWTQVATALEQHLDRNLEAYRANPQDPIAAQRLDAGIKMAELRFGGDYADVLKRARDVAGRRVSQ